MDDRWLEEAGLIQGKGSNDRVMDAAMLDRIDREDKMMIAPTAAREQMTRKGTGEGSAILKYPALLILPLLGFGLIVFLLILDVIG